MLLLEEAPDYRLSLICGDPRFKPFSACPVGGLPFLERTIMIGNQHSI